MLFLGRLVPVKGVDALLFAIAALSEPVRLHIAGDGPERGRLEKLARDLCIDARFEGWVAGAHRESLMLACDAIVVPSRPKDGLPIVLWEARARRLPIIATAIDAVAEQLNGRVDALLVPPNDLEALSRAIEAFRARQPACSVSTV